MIEARQLTKRFGGRAAIEGVTLDVARGEVVACLGPNGAGKSTTFRILAGVLSPDGGEARIGGHDLVRDPIAARRSLGYVPERPAAHAELTVEAHLDFVARTRDLGSAAARRVAVDRAIAQAGIAAVRTRRLGALARGFLQRASLATALVGDPPALLLDEPTTGLDPGQSAETRRLIRELGRDHAVFVSSHLLAEVEALCDRVIVLHQGRVLAAGEPGALATRLRRTTYVDVEAAATAARLEALLCEVSGVRGVARVAETAATARCRVEVPVDRDLRPALAAAVSGAGVGLLALVAVEPSLEDAFLSLTAEGSQA